MARLCRSGNGWLVGVCLLSTSEMGHAGEEPAAFQLVYTASAGCPNEADFVSRVTARTQHARLAKPGEDRRTFVVSLQAEGRRTKGSLTLEGPGGRTETREIVAETCEQAARAMSLIMALALDPASPEPGRETPPPPPPSDERRRRSRAPSPEGPPSSSTRARPAIATTGLSAELRGGVAPAPVLLVPGLFAAYGLEPRWMSAVVTMGLTRRVVGVELGEARFTYLAGRAELCAWLVQSPLRAGPCAAFSAGVVVARGAKAGHPGVLAETERHVEPWLEPAAVARLSWNPIATVEIDAAGGVGAPLLHSVYYFRRSSADLVVHQVPRVAGFAGIGAGVVFR